YSYLAQASDKLPLDKITNTYEVALTILFLDRLSTMNDKLLARIVEEDANRKWIELLAVRLIAAQKVNGGWTYDTPVLSLQKHKQASDNSCTQFATLAIWVAQRHKVPVDKSIKLIVKRFRSSQNMEGGWGYAYKKGGGEAESPPMICSGLVGLAVERGLEDPL